MRTRGMRGALLALAAVVALVGAACEGDGGGGGADGTGDAGAGAADTAGDTGPADTGAADTAGDTGPADTGAADTAGDAPPDATGCATPLTDDQLAGLRITLAPVLELQPGQSTTLTVGTAECCVFLEPVEACVTWSVTPAEGVTLDPATGALAVDPATPSGAVYTVTANVEDGKKVLTVDLGVYTPEDHPLRGNWHEVAQLPCDGGAEVAPEQSIGELRFWAGGPVWVTWTPFEVYVDWWGDYAFDLGAGTLSITEPAGNYVPSDIDGEGTFSLEGGGDLVLHGMWLGSPQGAAQPARCGHRFQK